MIAIRLPHDPRYPASLKRQQGLTLIELMVALVISLVIVLAAVASLTVARRGFSTVDAVSQLRDNGRFAADVIQRVGVQAGQRDPYFAGADCKKVNTTNNDCPPQADTFAVRTPAVMGVDNAIPSASDPVNSSTARSSGTLGYGSDVLILRYQMNRMYIGLNPGEPNYNIVDRTMIDCHGSFPSPARPPIDRLDRLYSVLYVGTGVSGEPALMCYRETSSGPLSAPLVDGVENFQVLYGVDGVVPNVAPLVSPDTVPDRYLRASEMVVTGDTVATAANWRRVRSVRIGMVLRGPPGSAQGQVSQPLYPFGSAKDSAGGSVGSAFASSSDVGTIFNPPNDGRLRQVVTFTVHLRNPQEP